MKEPKNYEEFRAMTEDQKSDWIKEMIKGSPIAPYGIIADPASNVMLMFKRCGNGKMTVERSEKISDIIQRGRSCTLAKRTV